MRSSKKSLVYLSAGVLAFSIAALFGSLYWWANHTTVLERPNVLNLKAEQVPSDGIPKVRVSGLCWNSSESVKNITVDREPHSVTVFVHIFLTRRGTTGNFSFDVPIPDGIDEIRFGKERAVVWRRAAN